jgi:hypothetical protein
MTTESLLGDMVCLDFTLIRIRHLPGAAMELGAFSISLAVNDIQASRAFYVTPAGTQF